MSNVNKTENSDHKHKINQWIARIDLTSEKIEKIEITKNHKWEKYAGRGLIAKILSEEIDPTIDPLSPENKLIIALGFLSGTIAPSSGRTSIGGKSPLTGGIKEANAGGRAGSMLASQGLRAIILEGKASELSIIEIFDGVIKIKKTPSYRYWGNYQLANELYSIYGKKIGIISIGPVGELQFPNASVAFNDLEGYPSRHAARGGLGAILGSKNIKAIVTNYAKNNSIFNSYKNLDKFKSIAKKWNKELFTNKRKFSKYGTALLVQTMNEVHGLPTQNFRSGQFENAWKISGEALNEYIEKNHGKYGLACSPGCPIQCSNLIRNPDGSHITSSLEYETIGLNGSNLLIDDLETLAKIDHFADDLGLDTIELGNTLAVMMEAGIINWGDKQKIIEIISNFNPNEVKNNQDSLSSMICLGCYRLGKKLGITRVPQVLGQGLPAYDPRTFKGMGVTFSTSPMGADHTAGPAILNRKAYSNKEYGKVYEPDGKIDLSKELQIFIMLLDSMGMCYFVGPSYESSLILTDLLNAMYDWGLDVDFWIDWAKQNLMLEHKFNVNAGITEKNQQLPKFLQKEAQKDIDHIWDIPKDKLISFWDEF